LTLNWVITTQLSMVSLNIILQEPLSHYKNEITKLSTDPKRTIDAAKLPSENLYTGMPLELHSRSFLDIS
jgi:hypothetical protein